LVKEFAIENKNGHMNGFLNVCLQAFWQFPWLRNEIKKFTQEKEIGS